MDATAIKGRGYYNESLRKADYRAALVLSAEHFYELCRSVNFSGALGADSRVGGWRPLSGRSPKAWHDGVQSRFIYFANILSPNSSGTRRVLPFFGLELEVEPSSSFDKSAPLEARQLFLGAILERSGPSFRLSIPISGVFFAGEDIVSRFVFFLLAKRL